MKPKDLLLYFARKWKERHGPHYFISFPKESPFAARLLEAYGEETARKIIDHYLFHLSDPWLASRGYTFLLMANRINDCALAVAEQAKKREAGQAEHVDFVTISEARKKLDEES